MSTVNANDRDASVSGVIRASGEQLFAVAMPLGGLGCGSVAICGDGMLRQWQVNNRVNHVALVPNAFFALQWQSSSGLHGATVLGSNWFWDRAGQVTATTSDHYVPAELVDAMSAFPMCNVATFEATYPIARLEYDLGPECPLVGILEAWSPFQPFDPDASGLPIAVFDLMIRNPTDQPFDVKVLGCMQNFVGWDGLSSISRIANSGYGGNSNSCERMSGNSVATWMRSEHMSEDDASFGELAWIGTGPNLDCCSQWSDAAQLWSVFAQTGSLPEPIAGPSAAGQTWNTAICSSHRAPADYSESVRFTLVWRFPNRFVDWKQWDAVVPADAGPLRIGNRYSERYSIRELAHRALADADNAKAAIIRYTNVWTPNRELEPILSAASSNVANLRTNVCLWTEDEVFHGFEGGCGASTDWTGPFGSGGCCAMNCTHVWNYDQTLAALFPGLFRTMRETDWKLNQHPSSGYLPHRTVLPLHLPRLWETNIGGPEHPALDGLFAAILKTYQYWLNTGDAAWAQAALPHVQQALEHVWKAHVAPDGVIHGEQPNTYDIHLFGPNTLVGSQYLASLLAARRLAEDFDEDQLAVLARERFEQGSAEYDRLCWDGEHYVQRVPKDCSEPYQYADGCASDQLLGQWWAHHLGLGYVLPQAHVRTAIQTAFSRNFRTPLGDFEQKPRVFASPEDSGLLNATYGQGQRPEVPLSYSDEVWTGVEYAFAGLCLFEGARDAALRVVSSARARYDGRERNPFNEVECGDHYVRAMSSWALLHAWHGLRFDAPQRRLVLGDHVSPGSWTAPATLGDCFAQVTREGDTVVVRPVFGALDVQETVVPAGLSVLVQDRA